MKKVKIISIDRTLEPNLLCFLIQNLKLYRLMFPFEATITDQKTDFNSTIIILPNGKEASLDDFEYEIYDTI